MRYRNSIIIIKMYNECLTHFSFVNISQINIHDHRTLHNQKLTLSNHNGNYQINFNMKISIRYNK